MNDVMKQLEKMTPSEELVMKVIWEADAELGLMEIRQRVNDKYHKHWKPQTVSTFLARLTRKRYLRCYRSGRVFYYQILVEFEDFQPYHAQKYLEFWHNGDAANMLASIMRQRQLTADEIAGIQELLADSKSVARGQRTVRFQNDVSQKEVV